MRTGNKYSVKLFRTDACVISAQSPNTNEERILSIRYTDRKAISIGNNPFKAIEEDLLSSRYPLL